MSSQYYTPGEGGGSPQRAPVPNGLQQIIEVYGDPDKNDDLKPDPEWLEENVVQVELPFYLVRSWDTKGREIWMVDFHYKAADDLVLALRTFADDVGGAEVVHENGWDITGGFGNLRAQKGDPDFLSSHSWWAAADMLPKLGPFGFGDKFKPKLPKQLVEAFTSLGWDWGGSWPQRNSSWPYDGMHFQRMTGW